MPAHHTQRRGFNGRSMHHETYSVDAPENYARELALTLAVSETLERHYPSHPWMVKVDTRQGIVQIALPLVMPKNQYWVLHIDKLAMDPNMDSVMRAGGAILEKHGIPRSGFRLDRFLEAREAGHIGKTKRLNALRRFIAANRPEPGQLFVPREYAPEHQRQKPRPRIIVNA
jgi:hypothetical protein